MATRLFVKGQSGNPKGRPKGLARAPSKEVRELAQRIFDEDYWQLKYSRIHACIEDPKIEALLLNYAFGAPPKEVHQTGLVVHLGPMQALQQLQQQEYEDRVTEPLPTLEASPVLVPMAALSSNAREEQYARAYASEQLSTAPVSAPGTST
jgi:hypothetical protein